MPPQLQTPKSFCPKPWTTLDITPSGIPRICCFSAFSMTEDGRPVSVYERSVADIWQSKYYKNVRAAMLSGVKVRECESCYIVEERTGTSPRIRLLSEWQKGYLNPSQLTFETLRKEHVIKPANAPTQLMLALGNRCNLTCRMCGSNWSSSIASDPVHSWWRPKDDIELRTVTTRLAGKHWSQDQSFVDSELLDYCDDLRYIYLIGGEPFLIKEFCRILEYLVSKGRAHMVSVSFSTNATVVNESVLGLLDKFRTVLPIISMDGVEKTYEYIRRPASWSLVRNNTLKLRDRFGKVGIHPTLQAYNCLELIPLFRFCRDNKLTLNGNILRRPNYLSIDILPAEVRQQCVDNIHKYLEHECPDNQRQIVAQFALRIAGMTDVKEEAGGLWHFMCYTNDLDGSRKQCIHDSIPTLSVALERAGIKWHKETSQYPPKRDTRRKIRRLIGLPHRKAQTLVKAIMSHCPSFVKR